MRRATTPCQTLPLQMVGTLQKCLVNWVVNLLLVSCSCQSSELNSFFFLSHYFKQVLIDVVITYVKLYNVTMETIFAGVRL